MNFTTKFPKTKYTKFTMEHQLLIVAKTTLDNLRQLIEASKLVTSNKARKKIETYNKLLERAEKDVTLLLRNIQDIESSTNYKKLTLSIVSFMQFYDPVKNFPAPNLKTQQQLDELAAIEAKLTLYLEYSYSYVKYFKFEGENCAIPETEVNMAVMFIAMDVSASFEDKKRQIGIQLSSMYYMYLLSQYDHVHPVFITYNTEADEVSEETFLLNNMPPGGTTAHKAFEKIDGIINKSFKEACWNIHIFNISDGDDFDTQKTTESIKNINKQKPNTHFIYNECPPTTTRTSLYLMYKTLKEEIDSIYICKSPSLASIYPVFKQLTDVVHIKKP